MGAAIATGASGSIAGDERMLRYVLALTALIFSSSWAAAGSWTDGLFDEISKDFGPVPRGPTLMHSFHLVNHTAAPLHISSVRVSCGCVQAVASRDVVAPGQDAAIVAHMDTHRFSGQKTVIIFVDFDQPSWEECRLWLQAYGRDDVALAPESFDLGRSKRGSTPSAGVVVTFSSGWQLLGAHCESNYVSIHISPAEQGELGISYRIEARARSDTPVGRWYTDVWLETSSPQVPHLRIPLTVEIESALTISPSVAALGVVKPGGEVERRVVLRGVHPFQILRIEGTDKQVSVKDSSPTSKSVHVLTVKLRAKEAGSLKRTLRVITDLKDDPEIDFLATASIQGQGAH